MNEADINNIAWEYAGGSLSSAVLSFAMNLWESIT